MPTTAAVAPTFVAAAPLKERDEEEPAPVTEPVETDCAACCRPKSPEPTPPPQDLSRREASAVGAIAPPTRVVGSECGRCCKPKTKSPKVSPNDGALV